MNLYANISEEIKNSIEVSIINGEAVIDIFSLSSSNGKLNLNINGYFINDYYTYTEALTDAIEIVNNACGQT